MPTGAAASAAPWRGRPLVNDARLSGMVGFRAWAAALCASARGIVSVGVAFWLASGCAGQSSSSTDTDQCPTVCENGAKCPGAPPLTQSCDDTCLGQDALATESNCHDLYVASIDCSAALKSVCTALVDCKNQIDAANACEQTYCAAHPSADVCAGVQ